MITMTDEEFEETLRHEAKIADRKAREECAEICDKMRAEPAWECADAIRATIKE